MCGMLLLPVYFVLSGRGVDLSRLNASDLGQPAAILVVAVTGKFAGAYVGARVGGLDGRHAAALGALLNTRGLTERVVLGVGLELGLLDAKPHSLMVVRAVATTALTGPLLSRILPATTTAGAASAGAVTAKAAATSTPTRPEPRNVPPQNREVTETTTR
ncbi:cation:proton antiporter [Streptomyces sp. NBC_01298]|nr:cation:proton antiporter [Streptomyces sp. NBC_01298]